MNSEDDEDEQLPVLPTSTASIINKNQINFVRDKHETKQLLLIRAPNSNSSCSSILSLYAPREGSNGLFMRSKLPLDIFIQIISYLPSQDLFHATQTCSRWREVLLMKEDLWSTLVVSLMEDREKLLRKVSVLAERFQGSLRVLIVTLVNAGTIKIEDSQEHTMPEIVENLQLILSLISKRGAGKLKILDFNLRAHSSDCSFKYRLEAIEELLKFCQYAAVNLVNLKIRINLVEVPLGNRILASLPSTLEKFSFAGTHSVLPDSLLHTFESLSNTPKMFDCRTSYPSPLITLNLRSIFLADVVLEDVDFPFFPFLQKLQLIRVDITNLYELLSRCSSSVKEIVLSNVHHRLDNLEEEDEEDDDDDDELAVLLLPELRALLLNGSGISVFKSSNSGEGNFVISTPKLKSISFAPHETTIDLVKRFTIAFQHLCPSQLVTMLRLSPSLKSLDLSGTLLSDFDLISTLPDAPASIKELTLTDPITDHFINLIHNLLPSLQYIEVTNSNISLPALARMAFRFQQAKLRQSSESEYSDSDDESGEDGEDRDTVNILSGLGSESSRIDRGHAITVKLAKDTHFYDFQIVTSTRVPSTYALLKMQTALVKKLCADSLNPSQVYHLVNTLVINPPPNGDDYSDTRKEMLGWSTLEENRADRPAANFEEFNSAKKELDLLIRMREESQAVQWFREKKNVLLELNVTQKEESIEAIN